jgi:hypothetical protein
MDDGITTLALCETEETKLKAIRVKPEEKPEENK